MFSMSVVMRIFVAMRVALAKTLLAVEHQKIHTKRIKSGHEYADCHREIRETRSRQMRELHRFYNAIFGVKPGQKRRADQRQRAYQRSEPERAS